MAEPNQQVDRFRSDYFGLTRSRPNGFVCPITLDDVSVELLCEGHILNEALSKASRKKVVQVADVDNYFGRTIEPDLIDYLNFPILSTRERLKRHKRLNVNLNGNTYELFRAGPEAGKKFQLMDIVDREGKVIEQRYIRAARIAPGPYRDVETEFFLTVHDFAITGALLKSAYLAIFNIIGYHYALDPVGNTVRRALASFYLNKATKAQAKDYFRDFRGAIIVSLGGLLDEMPDTLTGGNLLMHFAEGSAKTGILFAASCLFRVNSRTLVVTVPACWRSYQSLDALDYYRRLLANRGMRHSIHWMEFRGDSFGLSAIPMDFVYTDTLPESDKQ